MKKTATKIPGSSPGPGTTALFPLLFLALAVLASCEGPRTGEGPRNSTDSETLQGEGHEQERDRYTTTVEVITLAPSLLRDYLDIPAEISPASQVEVFADVEGELLELPLQEGDRVTRDQLLARIDPSRAGQRFSLSSITAPISGTVVELPFQAGSRINLQTPVARIATTDDLELTTHIPERYISRIGRDTPVEVRLDALPGETFSARISRLSPLADPASRTIGATLVFLERDRRIRPGFFARTRIILEEQPRALVVPQDAVIRHHREGTYVFVVDDGNRARQRPVSTGIEIDGLVELRQGVSEGEQIIIRGQNRVSDGTPVRLLEGDHR